MFTTDFDIDDCLEDRMYVKFDRISKRIDKEAEAGRDPRKYLILGNIYKVSNTYYYNNVKYYSIEGKYYPASCFSDELTIQNVLAFEKPVVGRSMRLRVPFKGLAGEFVSEPIVQFYINEHEIYMAETRDKVYRIKIMRY
jgi:hypothetical protein